MLAAIRYVASNNLTHFVKLPRNSAVQLVRSPPTQKRTRRSCPSAQLPAQGDKAVGLAQVEATERRKRGRAKVKVLRVMMQWIR